MSNVVATDACNCVGGRIEQRRLQQLVHRMYEPLPGLDGLYDVMGRTFRLGVRLSF
jgi:hypothetical protein